MRPDSRRATALVVFLAVLLLGLVAEWVAYGSHGYAARGVDTTHLWVVDLATGVVFLVSGLVAATRRPASRVGPLLVLTAIAWFAGTLQEPRLDAGSALLPSLLFLYRGPLAHLVMTFPSGRASDGVERLAVLVGYSVALLAPPWLGATSSIALVALFAAVAGRGYLISRGPSRRARLVGAQVALALALLVGGAAVARDLGLAGFLDEAVPVLFDVVLCASAARLTVALIRPRRATLTDIVVELGEAPSPTLNEELARLLGDASLRVGYWSQDSAAYLDDREVPLAPPDPRSGEVATRLDRDGEPVALLIHDPAVIEDPGLIDAIAAATRLAASNARLRAEVRAQVVELEASRRRLVEAADAEDRRLVLRLRDGAERRVDALASALAQAADAASQVGSPGTIAAIERADRQVGRTRDDLHVLARGLQPRILTEAGLAGAVAELARDASIPVDLTIAVDGVPRGVDLDAYLICSEALANVTKHARATRVQLVVAMVGDRIRIEIADDGAGGATMERGSGLRGIRDRTEALGGDFRVLSEPDSGTRVIAEIPLRQGLPAVAPAPAPVDSRINKDAEMHVSTDGASALAAYLPWSQPPSGENHHER